jgi:hypothetical protein
MKKEIWLIIILGIIIIVLAGVLLWALNKPGIGPLIIDSGIKILTPRVNEEIFSSVKIKGYINGDDWIAFEAQAGTVKLLDENNNVLGSSLLAVTDENWMKQFNNFEGELSFVSPKDQNGTLVFKNENPSGLPEKDKTFILPIKIAKVSTETTVLKVYFGDQTTGVDCNSVKPLERVVLKTEAIARVALEELLKGPNQAEKNAGYFTSINAGVKIQSLTISNGVAKVDFDEQLEYQIGGSCKVSAIRAQITQTLKQFSTVESVIISINGRTEDILQP